MKPEEAIHVEPPAAPAIDVREQEDERKQEERQPEQLPQYIGAPI